LKNKDKIKELSVTTPLSGSKLNRARSSIITEMEGLLRLFIENSVQSCVALSSAVIQEKAVSLYGELKKDMPQASNAELYTGSKGWFERFKKCVNFDNISLQGKSAGTNEEGATNFKSMFVGIIEGGVHTPQQVFNISELGLYWKKCLIILSFPRKGSQCQGTKCRRISLCFY
jgi:hypothetical protein